MIPRMIFARMFATIRVQMMTMMLMIIPIPIKPKDIAHLLLVAPANLLRKVGIFENLMICKPQAYRRNRLLKFGFRDVVIGKIV